jgi:hypothetical protein
MRRLSGCCLGAVSETLARRWTCDTAERASVGGNIQCGPVRPRVGRGNDESGTRCPVARTCCHGKALGDRRAGNAGQIVGDLGDSLPDPSGAPISGFHDGVGRGAVWASGYGITNCLRWADDCPHGVDCRRKCLILPRCPRVCSDEDASPRPCRAFDGHAVASRWAGDRTQPCHWSRVRRGHMPACLARIGWVGRNGYDCPGESNGQTGDDRGEQPESGPRCSSPTPHRSNVHCPSLPSTLMV